jgi:3'-5' exonuclease
LDLSKRNILVFDLETCGDNFEDYPKKMQDYLWQFSETEEKKLEVINQLAFNPLTARIVAIGMIHFNLDKGCVFINTENDDRGTLDFSINHPNTVYLNGNETEIITKFWDIIRRRNINMFVTFNGREFDCPFLMLRSIYHKIKPSFNLMEGSDFNYKSYHIDLLKEFTFNTHSGRGARRKFTLDFYCQKFGIKSPKSEGINGSMIGELYKNKRFQEIADYCMSDVIAETELFRFWNEYFNY